MCKMGKNDNCHGLQYPSEVSFSLYLNNIGACDGLGIEHVIIRWGKDSKCMQYFLKDPSEER